MQLRDLASEQMSWEWLLPLGQTLAEAVSPYTIGGDRGPPGLRGNAVIDSTACPRVLRPDVEDTISNSDARLETEKRLCHSKPFALPR